MTTPASSSRSSQIQKIIDSRKPMADLANTEIERLSEVAACLDQFSSFITANKSRIDEGTAHKLESVSSEISNLRTRIDEANQRFKLLAARFGRATLNIGVVGRARQGKSTLLQRITGLTDGEIPTGSEGHCTGAASVIENHPIADTHADVKFYTEALFLENVIRPFVEQLRPGYDSLGAPPVSLEEFASFKIPEDRGPKSLDPATDVERLKRLRSFQQSLDAYGKKLSGGLDSGISRNQIRSFVAQQDERGAPLHNWRAVHLVHVRCKFPHPDVGRIAFVDTPGLGDFISGAEDRLVDTVGRNLDVVAFLRRPPQVGGIDPADTNLHSLITRAIPDLNTADWSYFIINQEEKAESRNHYFRASLDESGIKTRLVIEATCTKTEHVSDALEKILGDVAVNLSNLDERLLQIARDRARDVWENLRSLVRNASVILPKAAPSNEKELKKLFTEVWDTTYNKVDALVNKYKANRDKPDTEFLRILKSSINGLEDIRNFLSNEWGNGGASKYFPEKMHELRVHLTQTLGKLDIELQQGHDCIREEIVQIFSEDSGGRLAFLKGLPHAEALRLLLRKWQDHDGDLSSPVTEAINLLLSDGLSFRGWIYPRVRPHVDTLDPNINPYIGYTEDISPKVVNDDIDTLWNAACYSIHEEIENASKEPSRSRFAMVQDFRDLIFYKGGSNYASGQWELFYGQHRDEIWPEEFGSLEHKARFIKVWNQHLESMKHLCSTSP